MIAKEHILDLRHDLDQYEDYQIQLQEYLTKLHCMLQEAGFSVPPTPTFKLNTRERESPQDIDMDEDEF
jgi:hypothetical protein